MPRQPDVYSYGSVFDEVAEDYDRHRPTYPDVLLDRACEAAGIGPGAAVLEIGCGTGQLTRSLLARGLRVTAVEPGQQLIARGYAADLFDDSQVAAVPTLLEHAADELNALLGTMSFWARLSPRQRDALAVENQTFHQRIGRPIRSSTVACLVVARRRPRT
jgi:predicted TPR repeat methyltransferase